MSTVACCSLWNEVYSATPEPKSVHRARELVTVPQRQKEPLSTVKDLRQDLVPESTLWRRRECRVRRELLALGRVNASRVAIASWPGCAGQAVTASWGTQWCKVR
ncbi:MAG: hypothetical protein ACI8S6_000883 [Myxococcota bacterium]|jgi:hypothetical protein